MNKNEDANLRKYNWRIRELVSLCNCEFV